MKIKFLGQGYNDAFNDSVAQELIKALKKSDFDSFICLTAFASRSGVSGLAPHIHKSKEHINEFRLIVGVDQKATSQEALEELLDLRVDVYIYYTTQRIIFHPKIYIFEGAKSVLIIIGSSNLTQNGLAQNIEASCVFEFDIEDEEGTVFLKQIKEYFAKIIDGSESNLKKLTAELLEELRKSPKIPSEGEKADVYEKEDETEEEQNTTNVKNAGDGGDILGKLFGSKKIQGLPADFKPKRKSKRTEAKPANVSGSSERSDNVALDKVGDAASSPTSTGKSVSASSVSQGQPSKIFPRGVQTGWIIDDNSEVLVAELSGPERWAQANFDISTFTGFFGATVATSNYFIELMQIDQTGVISIQQSQAVTVASSNYRFELAAAKGKLYPASGKPIGVFIRVTPQRFIYMLLFPQDQYYSVVRSFLDSQWTGSARRIKRIRTTALALHTALSQLPFWQL